MTVKRKKIGAAGRYGAGYGKVKGRLNNIESKQRKRQSCPFCDGRVKRQEKGVWKCLKCGKVFTGGVYFLQ